MSTPYRSARNNRFQLPAATPPAAEPLPQLTPDIFTERERANGNGANGATGRAGAAVAQADLSIIEARHPDIARAISLLWGFPEMNEYFDRLWLADTFHAPIDPDAMSELMLLSRVHQAVLPQRPGRNLASMYGSNRLFDHRPSEVRDPWADVPPRR